MPTSLKGGDIWEDDFGDGHEIPHANAEELDREWQARRGEFWNSGYREGLEAGKHDTVQEGFDQGYALGSSSGYKWGGLRGAALTLHTAAAKGLLPASAGASTAAQPLAALAPGQVMNAVGRRLMKKENNENSAEDVVAAREEEKKVEVAERQVQEAIAALGFDLKTTQPTET